MLDGTWLEIETTVKGFDGVSGADGTDSALKSQSTSAFFKVAKMTSNSAISA